MEENYFVEVIAPHGRREIWLNPNLGDRRIMGQRIGSGDSRAAALESARAAMESLAAKIGRLVR